MTACAICGPRQPGTACGKPLTRTQWRVLRTLRFEGTELWHTAHRPRNAYVVTPGGQFRVRIRETVSPLLCAGLIEECGGGRDYVYRITADGHATVSRDR